MSASDYLEEAFLNAVYRGVQYTSPVTVYGALFLSDPADDNSGVEVSTGGYARQIVTFSAPIDGPGGSKQVANNNQPQWSAVGADFGLVTHVAFFDSLSGGNMLDHAALDAPRNVVDTQTVEFLPGELVVRRT